MVKCVTTRGRAAFPKRGSLFARGEKEMQKCPEITKLTAAKSIMAILTGPRRSRANYVIKTFPSPKRRVQPFIDFSIR